MHLLSSAVAPVFSVNPAITGTAQVGNNLTTTTGTASNAFSYNVEWYSNTVASTSGATLITADSGLLTAYEDASLQGLYVFTKSTANGAGGLSAFAFSNIVGPVAAAAGLSSTNATLTSAAGAPVKVQLTFGSDIYAGMYLHIQRTTTAGNYTSPTMDILHSVTAQELGQTISTTGDTNSTTTLANVANVSNVIAGWAVSGTGIPANTTVASIAGNTITLSQAATATATGVAITLQEPGHIPDADLTPDGYTVPSGAGAQRYRWEREDGVVGPWSEVTYNVTASVATWYSAHGTNLANSLTVSNGNLTLAASSTTGNALGGARANPSPTPTKVHFEVTVTAMCTGTSPTGNIAAGFAGGVEDFTNGSSVPPGNSTTQGACVVATWNSSQIKIYYNGASHAFTLTPSVNPAVGDIIVCEADTVANTVTFWYIPVGTGTPQQVLAPTTLTSDIPGTWYGFGGVYRSNANGTDTLTANFGASTFAKTPTTGYSGW